MTEETGNDSLFALASTLAKEGLYAEATKVVQKALADGQCSDAEALDLQVRIYAREGLGLQAESCWQRVQQFAGLDPAYDRVLSRIRRSFLSRRSLFPLSIALAGAAVMVLLLWQTLLINPEFDNRLTSNEASLTAVREGLLEIKRSTQANNQEVSENISKLNGNLTALGQRVSERFAELSTATGVLQEHTAAIAHLNGKIDAIERVFEGGFRSSGSRYSKTHAPEAKPSAPDRIPEFSSQTPRQSNQISAVNEPAVYSSKLEKSAANGLPPAPIIGSPTTSPTTSALAPVPEAAVDVAVISTEPPKVREMSQDMGRSLLTGDENKFPDLRQLSVSTQQEIPSMKLSMLVYSNTPQKRMIIINGRTMREGDEVASGLKLEQIVPNGAIFKFRGMTFRKGVF